jgi:hypothetical protein
VNYARDPFWGEGLDGEREPVDAAGGLDGQVEAVRDRFDRLGGAGAVAFGASARCCSESQARA